MASKQIKAFVPYHEVRLAIETNQKGRVFAVNLEQYRELSALEGQSTIQDDGYVFIEGVKEKLKKAPRIRRNYLVTTPTDGTL